MPAGGDEALRGRASQVVKIFTRLVGRADDGLVKLESQSAGEPLDQSVVQGRTITAELVGEGDDDRQLVRLHGLLGQARSGDGLLAGLANPRGGGIGGDDGDHSAVAGELDLTGELHDSRRASGLFEDFAGNSGRQSARSATINIDGIRHFLHPF